MKDVYCLRYEVAKKIKENKKFKILHTIKQEYVERYKKL